MSVILAGTFAIGWTSALVDALRARNLPTVGDSGYDDPFALLMHRAKAMAACPQSVVVATAQDVAVKHPHVDLLLSQLAELLIPKSAQCVQIAVHVDPHEYFEKCIAEGVPGTHYDILNRVHSGKNYLDGPVVKTMHVSSTVADTPELLRDFVMTI